MSSAGDTGSHAAAATATTTSSSTTTTTTTATNTSSLPSPAPHKHKARRVTRACDNCRIRKSKCDGNKPCSSCTLHLLDCAYDDPKTARRRDLKYVQELEKTVERLTALLNVAERDRGIKPTLSSSSAAANERLHPAAADDPPHDDAESPGALLETMIEATGQLNVDESGNCDYRGNFAGLTLLRRIRERCDTLITGRPQFPRRDGDAAWMSSVLPPFESTSPPSEFPGNNRNILPPKERAAQLIATAFEHAFTLLHFIHRPSFNQQFEDLYGNSPMLGNAHDPRSLALLYEVLALGELYSIPGATDDPTDGEYKKRAESYFLAGQSLLDIPDIRDLTSLQALVCIIIYHQSSALISTCYSYIALGLAASVRMGLHRSATSRNPSFNPISRETCKRVFWVLRTMDTYVTTILGLPKTLADEDVDQDLPAPYDDDQITENAILTTDVLSKFSVAPAFTHHIELLRILDKIKRHVHGASTASTTSPPMGRHSHSPSNTNATYRVPASRISEIETDLSAWYAKLPDASTGLPPGTEPPTSPSEPVPIAFQKAQLLLRLFYAHVQMVLYRPFLHHITRRPSGNDANAQSPHSFNYKAYTLSSLCVHASSQVVLLASTLSAEPYRLRPQTWCVVYITFFAVVCLSLFALSERSRTDASVPDVTMERSGADEGLGLEAAKEAARGWRVLLDWARQERGLAVNDGPAMGPAGRCVECLSGLFGRGGPLGPKSHADEKKRKHWSPAQHGEAGAESQQPRREAPGGLQDPWPDHQRFQSQMFPGYPGPEQFQQAWSGDQRASPASMEYPQTHLHHPHPHLQAIPQQEQPPPPISPHSPTFFAGGAPPPLTHMLPSQQHPVSYPQPPLPAPPPPSHLRPPHSSDLQAMVYAPLHPYLEPVSQARHYHPASQPLFGGLPPGLPASEQALMAGVGTVGAPVMGTEPGNRVNEALGGAPVVMGLGGYEMVGGPPGFPEGHFAGEFWGAGGGGGHGSDGWHGGGA